MWLVTPACTPRRRAVAWMSGRDWLVPMGSGVGWRVDRLTGKG